MSSRTFSHDEISALIDYVLESRDPATVGLRKILKKGESGQTFACRPLDFEEFHIEGRKKPALSEQEQRLLQLEKSVAELKSRLEKQKSESEEKARREFERGRSEGEAEGARKGKEEARREFDSRIGELSETTVSFIERFESSRRRIYAESHHTLLRLAFAVARKILDTELSTNDDIVLSTIRKAVSYIADRDNLRVRVAEEDYEVVSRNEAFWKSVTDRLGDMRITADPRVDKGGCVIESNAGDVDARVGVQYDELRELVERVWDSVTSTAAQEDSAASDPRIAARSSETAETGAVEGAETGEVETDGAETPPSPDR